MNAINHANTLTSRNGITPFCPIAVRWDKNRREWCAMNRIDRGFSSRAELCGKLDAVLGRLNVTVTAIKSDEHSMYFLCEPGTAAA